ncbi:hypothetical protein, partial [Streptomyces sp. NPDC005859]|uniref:hypothetical protein n=1 Tax=Streptomyces sp. NPDC005859 TaxID=3157170 RepID=UPI0033C415DF
MTGWSSSRRRAALPADRATARRPRLLAGDAHRPVAFAEGAEESRRQFLPLLTVRLEPWPSKLR